MAAKIPAAAGWAVVQDGKVIVASVSPTRVGAQVNGLVTIFGIAPTAAWSDETVEAAWNYEASLRSAEIVRVAIQAVADGE